MRILLATTFLNCLTGSELFLYDLALGLQRRGHDVTCWVRDHAPDAPLPRLLAFNDVAVPEELPEESEVDAVVFQLLETFPIFRERYLGVPRFAVCHGPKLPAHIAPPDFPRTTHLALTREGFVYLRRTGHEHVAFTGYGVDLDRFAPATPIAERPRRAVVHSKYCDVDLVREACAELGIELTEVGRESWRSGGSVNHYAEIVEVTGDGRVIDHDPTTAAFHVERVLEPADVVFGLGRSAVEALAMGKACVVFGYQNVGDGLATARRLPLFARVNFSARARGHAFDVESMVTELRQYDPSQAEANREFAARHYGLEAFLDRFERLLASQTLRSAV
jgi:hypothetical protein